MAQLQNGIFPVQTSDYPRVVAVWEASVRATHDFVTEADIEFFRPIVRRVLPDLQLACVRDTDGRVVGYIAVSNQHVDMLFVHPDWRGQGVGRRLLGYAIDALEAVTLDVNEQNPQAVGFYLHMGFVVTGRSEIDGLGKPYPILHMRLSSNQ